MIEFEQALQNRLDEHEASVERKLELIESGEGDQRRVYSSLSKRERSIGIYYLVLGDEDEARQWFASSTSHNIAAIVEYRESAHEHEYQTWENEPLKFQDAFYTALLSQDRTVIDRVATEAANIPAIYPDAYSETRPWSDFVRTLSAFLRDDPTFEEHLEDLAEYATVFESSATAAMARQYEGLAGALEGLTADDPEQVAAGITAVLASQETERDSTSTKPRELVCLPAAAIYVLALMHGLDLDVDSPFIPDELDDTYIDVKY